MVRYTAELAALGRAPKSHGRTRKITGELSEKQMQRLADEEDISLHGAAFEGLQGADNGEAEARAGNCTPPSTRPRRKSKANLAKIAEMERTPAKPAEDRSGGGNHPFRQCGPHGEGSRHRQLGQDN